MLFRNSNKVRNYFHSFSDYVVPTTIFLLGVSTNFTICRPFTPLNQFWNAQNRVSLEQLPIRELVWLLILLVLLFTLWFSWSISQFISDNLPVKTIQKRSTEEIRMTKVLIIALIFFGAKSQKTFSGKLLSLTKGLKLIFVQKK